METDKELAELEKKIEAKKEEEVKAAAQEPEPQTVSNESEPNDPPKQDFDASAWVEKKGWKTPEDAAESYRQLEKAFHEKNQHKQQDFTPPANPYAPQPYQQPYQAPPYQQPNPYPYYAPQGPSKAKVAASYGLSEEDFEKVLAVSRDIADIRANQLSQDFQKWRDEQEKQNAKSSDMAEVMSNKAFHIPQVQKEMHEILEKQPQIFNEKKPYSAALKEALMNIGMKTITRGSEPSGSSLPTEPPKMAGSGSSGYAPKRSTGLPNMKEADKMPLEQLEKALKGANAFKTYADY